jgi:peptide deformylase
MAHAEEQVTEERDRAAEKEARRRTILATVRQYPDPVLRMRAREVTAFDGALEQLVERMVRVMTDAHGIGLAAPQIGVLQRVLVHHADEDGEPVVLVNARIVERGEGTDSMEEGCLSLGAAEVLVEVERPTRVAVEARAVDGSPLRVEAEGLEARVIQHEIDHLDGILIIDRTSPEQRKEALAKLRPQPVLGGLR